MSLFWAAIPGVTMIMVGCCLNVVSLEFIAKSAPGAGWLLTFLQFGLVTALGFVSFFSFGGAGGWGFKPTVIPMRRYWLLAFIFFTLSVINNKALDYRVGVPLHTVFRSSSLTASLIVGSFTFRKRYTMPQILSCLLVTIGIIVVTFAEQRQVASAGGTHTLHAPSATCCGADTSSAVAVDVVANSTASAVATAAASLALPQMRVNNPLTEAFRYLIGDWFAGVDDWWIGVSMLFVAFWLSALLGHMQDFTYETWGRVPDELMFWTHFLSLPGFVFAAPDMYASFEMWAHHTKPLSVRTPFGDQPMHILWMVVFNVASQFVCIRGVHTLTSSTNSLTTTVAITFRKFVSLILSVFYFQHTFTLWHWAGSLLTFAGVYWYTYAPRYDNKKATPPLPPATTAVAANGGDAAARIKKD